MPGKPIPLNGEQTALVVNLHKSGKTPAEIHKQTGISLPQVRDAIKRHDTRVAKAAETRETTKRQSSTIWVREFEATTGLQLRKISTDYYACISPNGVPLCTISGHGDLIHMMLPPHNLSALQGITGNERERRQKRRIKAAKAKARKAVQPDAGTRRPGTGPDPETSFWLGEQGD